MTTHVNTTEATYKTKEEKRQRLQRNMSKELLIRNETVNRVHFHRSLWYRRVEIVNNKSLL